MDYQSIKNKNNCELDFENIDTMGNTQSNRVEDRQQSQFQYNTK